MSGLAPPAVWMLSIFSGPDLLVLALLALPGLLLTVFWIVELVDAIRREFSDPTTKILWVLVILITHALGALIYYCVGKKQGTRPARG